MKEQSAQHTEIIKMQKEQDFVKNTTIKQAIRQQKMEAEEKKDLMNEQKRLRNRNRIIDSILEENHRRMEVERQVAQLEKVEYELI